MCYVVVKLLAYGAFWCTTENRCNIKMLDLCCATTFLCRTHCVVPYAYNLLWRAAAQSDNFPRNNTLVYLVLANLSSHKIARYARCASIERVWACVRVCVRVCGCVFVCVTVTTFANKNLNLSIHKKDQMALIYKLCSRTTFSGSEIV